jgi:hypothetical protein
VAQFDEQLRLIAAEDEETAFVKAQSIGLNEEENYPNLQQQIVQWKFINVAELYQLRELNDGIELYSKITENEAPDFYINTINRKAMNICTGSLRQLILK